MTGRAPRAAGDSWLNAGRRALELDALTAGEHVDVLVIGGGVTGTGVALDAATRGLCVALIERGDLATGTSRWSSKLVHGGLRYLANGQVRVAWDSARERHLLMTRTAPHLVRPLPQLLPFLPGTSRRDARLAQVGIQLGDALRAGARTPGSVLPRVRRVRGVEARRWVPALGAADGALLSWDGQLEDDARLVVALARTAAAHGARILTRVEALELSNGALVARDAVTGGTFELRARHVINATGVWASSLAPAVSLTPSRGSHVLVAAGALGDPRAQLTVPLPGAFGRFVFAIPRPDGLVLCGITDEPCDGPLEDAPAVPAADETFILDALARALDRPLGAADVVGRFAGFRPLLAPATAGEEAAASGTAGVSRDHTVVEDPDSGLVTVTGGKLTTYRAMARDAVDVIAARPDVRAGRCVTARTSLVGAGPTGGAPPALVRRYGAEAQDVAAGDTRQLVSGVPLSAAEVAFALAREGALSAEDIVDRRVRVGLVDAWRAAVLPAVEALVRGEAPDIVPV